MIKKKVDGASILQFPNLVRFSNINHGIFMRKGGVSPSPYKSLNIGLKVGDEDRNVLCNRNIISRCMGEKDILFVHQVHGTGVLIFDHESEKINGADNRVNSSSNNYCIVGGKHFSLDIHDEEKRVGDALITKCKNILLGIQIADCQAVILYDPGQKVIANIHVGWRGSTANIIGHTVGVMKKHFCCVTDDMVAGVGPSLGPCCAEFVKYKEEIPRQFWKYKDEKSHFDLWAISRDQLSDAGIRKENIFLSRICTKCNTDLFYSYRGEKTTGRFAAVVGLE